MDEWLKNHQPFFHSIPLLSSVDLFFSFYLCKVNTHKHKVLVMRSTFHGYFGLSFKLEYLTRLKWRYFLIHRYPIQNCLEGCWRSTVWFQGLSFESIGNRIDEEWTQHYLSSIYAAFPFEYEPILSTIYWSLEVLESWGLPGVLLFLLMQVNENTPKWNRETFDDLFFFIIVVIIIDLAYVQDWLFSSNQRCPIVTLQNKLSLGVPTYSSQVGKGNES